SFSDELLNEFHLQDGLPYVALAGATLGTTLFALTGAIPDPDVAAFQVPPDQMVGGQNFQVPELLLTTRQAHCLGYAVHIWTNGDQDETDAAYERFYNSGADGVMTSDPSRLRAWVDAHDITQPDGRNPLSWPIQCATPPPDTSGPYNPQPPAPTPKSKCKKAKGKHRSATSSKHRSCGKKKHKKHQSR